MYLLCMIKARIRWCSCRVENILTLGKLLSLWFCFLLHSILFLIFQTSYRTYKIIPSYELARPVMGTIFLVTQHCIFSARVRGGFLVDQLTGLQDGRRSLGGEAWVRADSLQLLGRLPGKSFRGLQHSLLLGVY